jgi:DNA-binding transcriptional ArsR family regulator
VDLASDEHLVTVLEALGDTTRLRILETAIARGDVACSELDKMLGLAKSTISYHTKILSAAGLIHTVREGRFFRYTPTTLATEALPALKELVRRLHPADTRSCL